MSPIIISIEGNIGSGKSTLLQHLKQYYNNKQNNSIIFLKEPVDEWEKIKDKNGITMIQKFYENQEKYSFSFQMMAYISRLALLKEAVENNPNAIIITERSLYTDKLVFAKMLYDSNKIEDVNYQIYLKWFDTFAKENPIETLIYVKADPEVCSQRIKKRSRNGESNIPLDYLISCNSYHNDMVKENFYKNILELNGNIDIYENEEQISNWIESINKFIL